MPFIDCVDAEYGTAANYHVLHQSGIHNNLLESFDVVDWGLCLQGLEVFWESWICESLGGSLRNHR